PAPSGAAPPSSAGECPANQMRAEATKPVTTAAKGVTDKVLSQIDLAGEKIALKGHLMRVRKLEIQPGGIVPWHSHEDRPALIYVVTGEIYEHASNCAVPILHKAGEVARETPMPQRTGGRTTARGRWGCCRSTSSTIPTTTTCDRKDRIMSGALRAFTIGLTAFLTVVDLFATQAILPALTVAYGGTPAAMGFAR